MKTLIAIMVTVVIVGLILYGMWNYWQEQKEAANKGKNTSHASSNTAITVDDEPSASTAPATDEQPANQSAPNCDTPQLVMQVLHDLNCKVVEDSPSNWYYFTYQGENFGIYATEDSCWVSLADIEWYSCSLDDIDAFSQVQKIINLCNTLEVAKAVYRIDKEENKIAVWSMIDFVLIGDFPHLDNYMQAMFNELFRYKRAFALQMAKAEQIASSN